MSSDHVIHAPPADAGPMASLLARFGISGVPAYVPTASDLREIQAWKATLPPRCTVASLEASEPLVLLRLARRWKDAAARDEIFDQFFFQTTRHARTLDVDALWELAALREHLSTPSR